MLRRKYSNMFYIQHIEKLLLANQNLANVRIVKMRANFICQLKFDN